MGDCYYLASLSALAMKPWHVRSIFYKTTRNSAGCYLLKFIIDGVPTGVMVDETLLFKNKEPKKDYELGFAKCLKNDLWVAIIEKAYAKILGGWSLL